MVARCCGDYSPTIQERGQPQTPTKLPQFQQQSLLLKQQYTAQPGGWYSHQISHEQPCEQLVYACCIHTPNCDAKSDTSSTLGSNTKREPATGCIRSMATKRVCPQQAA